MLASVLLGTAGAWSGSTPEQAADKLVKKASAAWSRDDFVRAKSFAEKAIEKAPDHPDAHALLCSILMTQAGREARAFTPESEVKSRYLEGAQACGAAARGVAGVPASSFLALRARALVKAEAWDAAVPAYEDWLASAPDDGRIVGGYAALLERVGRAEDAVEALERAKERATEFDRAARFEFVWERFSPEAADRLRPLIDALLVEETDAGRRAVLETLRAALSGTGEDALLAFLGLVDRNVLYRAELDLLWDSLGGPDLSMKRKTAPSDTPKPGDSLTLPQLIDDVQPRFPEVARKAFVEGRVILLARINVDGTVNPVWVVKATAAPFAEAAQSCVLRRRYRPALRDSVPVPFPFTIRVDFRFRR